MVVYLDDDEAVDVEQLSLDEARLVLARAVAQLSGAYNIAHAQWLPHISFDRNFFQRLASEINRIRWFETVLSLLEPLSAYFFHDLAQQLFIYRAAQRNYGIVSRPWV